MIKVVRGNPTPEELAAALAVVQARAAYAVRPTIFAADGLAWALYQRGHYAEAWHYSQEALRLGTQDARLHFHAGIIALALGQEARAREHLRTAFAINPDFSVRYAPQLRSVLATHDWLPARPLW